MPYHFWVQNIKLGKIWPCRFNRLKKTKLEPQYGVSSSKNKDLVTQSVFQNVWKILLWNWTWKFQLFYLEKKKSFIPKKIFFGRTANLHPKDGVSRLNFPEGFGKIIAKIDSEFRKCLSAQFFGNSYIPKCQTSFKQARKGFPPISANKNFLGIFWRKLLENFWECFWNSLEILWELFGNL